MKSTSGWVIRTTPKQWYRGNSSVHSFSCVFLHFWVRTVLGGSDFLGVSAARIRNGQDFTSIEDSLNFRTAEREDFVHGICHHRGKGWSRWSKTSRNYLREKVRLKQKSSPKLLATNNETKQRIRVSWNFQESIMGLGCIIDFGPRSSGSKETKAFDLKAFVTHLVKL